MVALDGQSEDLQSFFGVFCADLLAVDTGNAFCRLLGRVLFVILFRAEQKQVKTWEELPVIDCLLDHKRKFVKLREKLWKIIH